MSEKMETPEEVAERLVCESSRHDEQKRVAILYLAGAPAHHIPLVLETRDTMYPGMMLRQFVAAALRERDRQWEKRQQGA